METEWFDGRVPQTPFDPSDLPAGAAIVLALAMAGVVGAFGRARLRAD
jgi:hypothetical protein